MFFSKNRTYHRKRERDRERETEKGKRESNLYLLFS